ANTASSSLSNKLKRGTTLSISGSHAIAHLTLPIAQEANSCILDASGSFKTDYLSDAIHGEHP
ncbi:MAG: hypothetical protein WBW33_06920, partial [Bryobacteraceae bacterium]